MSLNCYLSARGGVGGEVRAAAEAHFGKTAKQCVHALVFEDIKRSVLSLDGVDVNFIDQAHQRPRLFLADMDSTMIGQECIDELADYAGVKSKIADITERAMQGELDFEEALRARVGLLAGLSEDALETCYRERIVPNEGAVELLSALKAAGVKTVLVSGGFTFFASRIAARLGFDKFHANVFEIKNGKLTGGLVGDIIDKTTKRIVLEAEIEKLGIERAKSVTIGDGANDLAMIEAAGVGVAYRAKPALKLAADIALDHSDLDVLIDILAL